MPDVKSIADMATQTGLPLSSILAHHSAYSPNRAAIVHSGKSISWQALDEASNAMARAFSHRGVAPGDFVTIGLPNSIEIFVAAFAAWKCGATPNPISSRMPREEVQGIVDLVKPALVVGGPRDLAASRFDLQDFASGPQYSIAALPEALVSRHWKAMTSGGSTGRPKVIVDHNRAFFDPWNPVLNQRAGGTVLVTGPLYNNGPFMCAMLALIAGNTLVLMPRFDPAETLALIERHAVDWAYVVPTMMKRIWRLDDGIRSSFDLSSLRVFFHTAAMCPAWLKQAWIDWLGPERILEGYGGTEGQGTTLISGSEWLAHRGSVGRAAPGARIVILDDDGKELPAGEVGEIFFLPDDPERRTYHYLGADRREVGSAGSVGDLGYLDGDGWLYLADRRTDLIICGGANVYPAEVEAALDPHPQVKSSIVIGLPDEDLGARVHAIVQVDPGQPLPDGDNLRSWLRDRIVSYKIPATFEFVHDELRDDAGKARRSLLRAERMTR